MVQSGGTGAAQQSGGVTVSSADGPSTGDVLVQTGIAASGKSSGALRLSTGDASFGQAGTVEISAGRSAGDANGNIEVMAGSSLDPASGVEGGSLTLSSGAGGIGSTSGEVRLESASGEELDGSTGGVSVSSGASTSAGTGAVSVSSGALQHRARPGVQGASQ